MITKTYIIDEILFDNIINKYGEPIYSKTTNIFCFWKLDYMRINLYKNKECPGTMKVVIQGDDIREDGFFFDSLSINNRRKELNEELPLLHAGGDESGKGEDFGPLVITIVVLTRKQQELFLKHNIRDSKELSNDVIINFAKFILNNIEPKQYCTLTINPSWINEKRTEGHNLHKFMIDGYDAAAQEISKRYPNDIFDLVIDGFVNQNSYNDKHNFGLTPNMNIILETKAENKYISVACASIISRYQYLSIINEYDKTLKYTFPIGAHFENNIKPFISFLIKNEVPYENGVNLIKSYIKNNMTKCLEEYEHQYKFYCADETLKK